MRKLVIFMLALFCLLSLSGCNAQQENLPSKYLKERNGEQYLILPKSKSEEGIMYLCVEIMVDIDPPQTITDENGYELTSGCGIDHDHIRFDEPISSLILKLAY